jgi:hypothetical protein
VQDREGGAGGQQERQVVAELGFQRHQFLPGWRGLGAWVQPAGTEGAVRLGGLRLEAVEQTREGAEQVTAQAGVGVEGARVDQGDLALRPDRARGEATPVRGGPVLAALQRARQVPGGQLQLPGEVADQHHAVPLVREPGRRLPREHQRVRALGEQRPVPPDLGEQTGRIGRAEREQYRTARPLPVPLGDRAPGPVRRQHQVPVPAAGLDEVDRRVPAAPAPGPQPRPRALR